MRVTHRRNLGSKFSEGARLLWSRLVASGEDLRSVPRALNCSVGLSNRWLYGDRRPSIEWAKEIQEIYGISASLWACEPTQTFELPRLWQEPGSSKHLVASVATNKVA